MEPLDTFNIDGLDINLASYFENNDVKFNNKMKCLSLDTKYLYELRFGKDAPDFSPLFHNLTLSSVESIESVNLPRKEVCITSDDGSSKRLGNYAGYKSFTQALLESFKVGEISCPFIDDDNKLFIDVVNNIANATRCPVKVIFPYLFPNLKVEVAKLKSDSEHLVTLVIPEESKEPLGSSYTKANLKIETSNMAEIVSADPPPTMALNTYSNSNSNRGRDRVINSSAVSLYFDAVPSQNLYWQSQTQFIELEQNWKRLDEYGRNLYGLNLEQSILDLRKGKLYTEKDSTGKVIMKEDNVTIAILDTGIRKSHKAFISYVDGEKKGKSRVIAVHNFVKPINQPGVTNESAVDWKYENSDHIIDRNGHGTHCASIAAGGIFAAEFPKGKDEAEKIYASLESGAAPFANIIMCKIATSVGYSKPEWMANAVNWLIDEEKKGSFIVDIISTSVGYREANLDLRKAICRANMEGKIVVCAASNDGRRRATNITFPGRFGDVICVGGHDNNGQPSRFSPIGREIDFLAPSEDIWAALPSKSGKMVYPFSGTSAAAPFVAGVAALILLAAQRVSPSGITRTEKPVPNKKLRQQVTNITVMREIMRRMCTKHGHHDEATGYGNLDPWNVFSFSETYFKEIVQKIFLR